MHCGQLRSGEHAVFKTEVVTVPKPIDELRHTEQFALLGLGAAMRTSMKTYAQCWQATTAGNEQTVGVGTTVMELGQGAKLNSRNRAF